ncbi:hypothetical protein M6B38_409685 [Iris pallida]|uniref:Uncharacterized protein n=1 Tax=Iris pallida TaxID=29817 RepID=A0AAX6FPL6_IRIPA|nr:hypothetical protein M6B38_409685 [Iris pallida]
MIIRLYFKYFEHVFSTLFQSFKKKRIINCFVLLCLSLFNLGVALAIFINLWVTSSMNFFLIQQINDFARLYLKFDILTLDFKMVSSFKNG